MFNMFKWFWTIFSLGAPVLFFSGKETIQTFNGSI